MKRPLCPAKLQTYVRVEFALRLSLGLYLGDGNINGTGRSFQLRLTLDTRYPGIIESAMSAMGAVVPHGRVHVRVRPGARVLESGWKQWPECFPQHGPGRKHRRPMTLTGWQRALVDEHPQEFLRGLIHSDGCRVTNRFTVALPSSRRAEYAYPRCFFSTCPRTSGISSASTARS